MKIVQGCLIALMAFPNFFDTSQMVRSSQYTGGGGSWGNTSMPDLTTTVRSQTPMTPSQREIGGNPISIPTSTPTSTPPPKSSSSGSSSSKSSSSSSLSAMQDKLRKSIASGFSGTLNAYNDLIGWLPGQEASLRDQVGNLANTNKQSINNSLSSELSKFGTYRQDVADQQKGTLQDLADNTRNLFQAGNTYLGARGAGDSSATGMYSAALTQQANKQRGDVQNQVNDMYKDINLKETDVRQQAQQQLDAVDTWAASRLSEVMQQFQDLQRQLTLAKGQANDMQKQALAELDKSLFASAQQQLYNLQAQATQYKNQVSSWADQANQQQQYALTSMRQTAQFNPGDIVAPDQANQLQMQQTQTGDWTSQVSGGYYKKNNDGSFTFIGN